MSNLSHGGVTTFRLSAVNHMHYNVRAEYEAARFVLIMESITDVKQIKPYAAAASTHLNRLEKLLFSPTQCQESKERYHLKDILFVSMKPIRPNLGPWPRI